jgi:hypothetical protein
MTNSRKRIGNTMTRCMQARKTTRLGVVTPLEPMVKVASQSVFYALRTRDGTHFLEYFNSLPSATPREVEEIKILLGISNETFERQN